MLLQVLDEGRLTDNQGRTVNFRNTLIIMTSNLGAETVMARTQGVDEANRDRVHAEIREELLALLKRTLRPEFLNRIDEVVVFRPLGQGDIRRIVDLQFARLQAKAAAQNIQITLSPEAEDWITREGYDPVFGARPLKRVLQRAVVNPLASAILDGRIMAGQSVRVVIRENVLDFEVAST